MTEDLSVLFADFGVTVAWGSVTGLGLLDMPDEIEGGGLVMSREYLLTVMAGTFDGLDHGDTMTVDGTSYTVRTVRKIEDGKLMKVSLSA